MTFDINSMVKEFSHEKLDVYKRALEFLAQTSQLAGGFPVGWSELTGQLRRAALSIPLNIAEGVGKQAKADKQRYFGIARGSALECAAILDAIEVLKLGSTEVTHSSRKLLLRVVQMLTGLMGVKNA